MTDGKRMPFTGHFKEMRQRFIRSLIVIIVATVIAFIFWQQIFEFLLAPAPADMNVQAIEMLEMLSSVFRVCLTAGLVIAMPYLVYQLFAFLSPALTPKEKRIVYMSVPFVGGLFIAGMAFAYFVALPRAIEFLVGFGTDVVEIVPRIKDYINIVTRLLMATGLSFEMPVIIMVLARVGIASPNWLASKRKIWFVVAFILAAIITPTIDPITQTAIAGPLIVLYEISIWLARLVYRKKAEPAATGS
jgi:sec-independent protein translocase protein TatC